MGLDGVVIYLYMPTIIFFCILLLLLIFLKFRFANNKFIEIKSYIKGLISVYLFGILYAAIETIFSTQILGHVPYLAVLTIPLMLIYFFLIVLPIIILLKKYSELSLLKLSIMVLIISIFLSIIFQLSFDNKNNYCIEHNIECSLSKFWEIIKFFGFTLIGFYFGAKKLFSKEIEK